MVVPFLIQKIIGSVTWRIPVTDPVLFLTFDDGPVPEVTPSVLEILKGYHAKATFFCVGENVKKNPDIFKAILQDGHAVGNHTFSHLNGWKTRTQAYLENVRMCETELNGAILNFQLNGGSRQVADKMLESRIKNQDTRILKGYTGKTNPQFLFRPPYGKLHLSQIRNLKSHYTIIMWDVLSKDYDQNVSSEKCFRNVAHHATPGSIIVFHDSIKAKERVLYTLPKVLEYFSERNFSFRAIGK